MLIGIEYEQFWEFNVGYSFCYTQIMKNWKTMLHFPYSQINNYWCNKGFGQNCSAYSKWIKPQLSNLFTTCSYLRNRITWTMYTGTASLRAGYIPSPLIVIKTIEPLSNHPLRMSHIPIGILFWCRLLLLTECLALCNTLPIKPW